MKKIIILFVFGTLIISCNKEKFFDGPDFFEDDFENYSALEDLLSDEDENWSFTQLTNENNIILVDTSKFHSGNRSLKFIAARSTNELLSKCSIAKQNMAFWEGETVRLSGWYFIEGTNALDWLFLFDLEEQTAIGAGPGMRLALVNNQLLVEYKFYESSILQPIGQEIDFPRNEWVEIVWEVKLSQKNEGTVKLWQNGILIIDTKNNRTLPKDLLYSQQGTKGMYSSVEIGITANSKDNDLTIWVDDIIFERIN
ncbi:MAG: heparin lyase I family protein [Bacteroidetes bacterium]|nr:heparin lyase I family protein [Bacteroidota bacterium]MBK7569311.1 heparin lyase I family protein [Bacteroidota bacterium]